MPLTLAFGTYFVIWWITLFAVLPFGVTSQQEENNIVPGTPESAPSTPLLWKKVVATTLISGVIFLCANWLYMSPSVTLDNIPLLPKF